MLSGIAWTFPTSEISQYAVATLLILLPVVILSTGLAVFEALIEIAINVFLRVLSFFMGVPYNPTKTSSPLDDVEEEDYDDKQFD